MNRMAKYVLYSTNTSFFRFLLLFLPMKKHWLLHGYVLGRRHLLLHRQFREGKAESSAKILVMNYHSAYSIQPVVSLHVRTCTYYVSTKVFSSDSQKKLDIFLQAVLHNGVLIYSQRSVKDGTFFYVPVYTFFSSLFY